MSCFIHSFFHDSRKGNEVEKRVFTVNYYEVPFSGSQCKELAFVCQDKGGVPQGYIVINPSRLFSGMRIEKVLPLSA